MAPLTAEVQNIIAVVCGISVVPLVAIPLAILLMRQLGWFRWEGGK